MVSAYKQNRKISNNLFCKFSKKFDIRKDGQTDMKKKPHKAKLKNQFHWTSHEIRTTTPSLTKSLTYLYFKYLKDVEMPTKEKKARMREVKWFLGSMKKQWYTDVARFVKYGSL